MKQSKAYKIWALRLFVWLFIVNMASFYLSVNFFDFGNSNAAEVYQLRQTIFSGLSLACFIGSIVMLIISHRKKESKDWRFYVPTIGLSVYVLFSVLLGTF